MSLITVEDYEEKLKILEHRLEQATTLKEVAKIQVEVDIALFELGKKIDSKG